VRLQLEREAQVGEDLKKLAVAWLARRTRCAACSTCVCDYLRAALAQHGVGDRPLDLLLALRTIGPCHCGANVSTICESCRESLIATAEWAVRSTPGLVVALLSISEAIAEPCRCLATDHAVDPPALSPSEPMQATTDAADEVVEAHAVVVPVQQEGAESAEERPGREVADADDEAWLRTWSPPRDGLFRSELEDLLGRWVEQACCNLCRRCAADVVEATALWKIGGPSPAARRWQERRGAENWCRPCGCRSADLCGTCRRDLVALARAYASGGADVFADEIADRVVRRDLAGEKAVVAAPEAARSNSPTFDVQGAIEIRAPSRRVRCPMLE
jgi:hypothetical protein